MEEIYEKTLLYDFYGDLLTKRQKEIYTNVIFNDMSLSEASKEFHISRQGVHDLLKRSEEALLHYEETLHMIRQYEKIRKLTDKAEEILLNSEPSPRSEDLKAVLHKIQKEIS